MSNEELKEAVRCMKLWSESYAFWARHFAWIRLLDDSDDRKRDWLEDVTRSMLRSCELAMYNINLVREWLAEQERKREEAAQRVAA